MGMEIGRGITHSTDNREKKPAPDALLQMNPCNCSGGCKTLRYTCRKHGLECAKACGPFHDDIYDNMTNEPVTEEDDEQDNI